jgi:hypothetical protein
LPAVGREFTDEDIFVFFLKKSLAEINFHFTFAIALTESVEAKKKKKFIDTERDEKKLVR